MRWPNFGNKSLSLLLSCVLLVQVDIWGFAPILLLVSIWVQVVVDKEHIHLIEHVVTRRPN